MNSLRKSGWARILLAAAALLSQNCATIVNGTTQKIPVTASFFGDGPAKVFVNGKLKGTAPLTLRLMKNKAAVIRIEKDGYNPQVIGVKRDGSLSAAAVMGNLLLGPLVGHFLKMAVTGDPDIADQSFLWSIALTTAAFVAADLALGAGSSLVPISIDVVLTKIDGAPRLETIDIAAARVSDVRWLRVRLSGPGQRR